MPEVEKTRKEQRAERLAVQLAKMVGKQKAMDPADTRYEQLSRRIDAIHVERMLVAAESGIEEVRDAVRKRGEGVEIAIPEVTFSIKRPDIAKAGGAK